MQARRSFTSFAFPLSLPKQVFFYKAYFIDGEIELDQKEVVDYAWVTREELQKYLSPDLFDQVKKFLLD
jgi:large subunit ribosomal protein L46